MTKNIVFQSQMVSFMLICGPLIEIIWFREGLEPINIYISDECTICNSDKYYSYRVHKEKTGRQVAVIALP